MRETSRAAVVSIHDSVAEMRTRAFAVIRDCNGATCDEIEVVLELRHQTASARLRELTLEGKICDSGQRRNTRSGRKAIVWEVCEGLSSPLKWAGGKSWLLPRLRELYAPYRNRRLVEPFVGSMAVALGLRPERVLLRDVNLALIRFYSRIREPRQFSIEMMNDEAFYYRQRDRFNEQMAEEDPFSWFQAGELFYYLNRTCFNGLCRFNREGRFNVPFGKYKKINYQYDFSKYAVALTNWRIEWGSFESTVVNIGDFVYLDPPYDGTFADYSADGFDWDKQVKLAEMFAAHDGPVVASNAATARILNLYGKLGFDVDLVAAPRSISSNGDRADALEMIATKNLTRRHG